MDGESVSQWMDAEAVRALAESLLEPASDQEADSSDEAFGDEFVGFAEVPLSQSEPTPSGKGTSPVPEVDQGGANAAEVISPKSKSTVASRAEFLKSVVKVNAPSPPVRKPIVPDPAAVDVSKVVYLAKKAVVSPVQEKPKEAVTKKAVVSPVQEKPKEAVTKEAVTKGPVPKPRIDSPFTIAPNQILPPIPVKTKKLKSPQSEGPTRETLDTFGSWLKRTISTRAFFVCDATGRVLVDEVGSEKLVTVAKELVKSSNDGAPSHHVKVGPEKVLEVIQVKVSSGTALLGVVVPRPLSESAVAAVSNALNKAL